MLGIMFPYSLLITSKFLKMRIDDLEASTVDGGQSNKGEFTSGWVLHFAAFTIYQCIWVVVKIMVPVGVP